MQQNIHSTDSRYQAKAGFVHRKVAGADVLISVGGNIANFNGYIELNPSAACIWDGLKTPATCAQLAQTLVDTFGITSEEALQDVQEYVAQLLEHDMAVMV